MSARKKTFVKSAFSQMPSVENDNNISKDPRTADSPTLRRSTRQSSKPVNTEVAEVIDLDTEVKDEAVHVAQPNENWIEAFAPTNKDDLALHPKKIVELQKWFQHCDFMRKQKYQPAQFCLLTGPSGSGKTAAVRVIAKEMKYSIQEWINPVDQEVVYNLGDQFYGESNFTSSRVDAFKAFLFQASRYRSLFETKGDKRLLVIEDFPNFLLRDSSSFEEILYLYIFYRSHLSNTSNYMLYGKSPLIFIVTDAKRRGLNISYNLFNDQLKQKLPITHISFNPVASTIMLKAMGRFCGLMFSPPHYDAYRPPTPNLIDSIIVSAQGDVRNALINLHFSSLKGAPNLSTELLELQGPLQDTKSATRKRKLESALRSVGRDDSLTMMHALGRVFNPKYTESKKLLHTPEVIAETFVTEPKTFIDLVHANYLRRFSDIESVLTAINGISLCDRILNEYRDDSLALLGLNIGIRNVMVANAKPVALWMPIKGPKRLNADSAKIPLRSALKVLPTHHNISKHLYALDYKTYVNILVPGNC